MEISDKLAFEIYTIVGFHIPAILILFLFSLYIYLKALKTPLLYSYLGLVSTFLLWMLAKIFKTVAPTIEMRWFFILVQYIGINFLGFCLVVFAFAYTRNRLPSKRALFYLALLPLASLAVVVTNPLHMQFYRVFTFYKDRFGPLFYPTQAVQYAYWIVGIIMVARGFRHQKFFEGKRGFAMLFSTITLLPIMANVYYILFKLGVFPWIFPFPTFDFTPIAGSIAIILFMIPALKFKFFDISPISYAHLFNTMETGVTLYHHKKKKPYGANPAYSKLTNLANPQSPEGARLHQWMESDATDPIEIRLSPTILLCTKKVLGKSKTLIFLTPITDLVAKRSVLENQNLALQAANTQLDHLAEATRALAKSRTKSMAAQHVHDILGHSLTVVIGTTDLAAAAAATDPNEAISKLQQVQELLRSSLNDLKNALAGKSEGWGQTSLVKAIDHLKNPAIDLDFTVQGRSFEIPSDATHAVFRLCQEAITNAIRHGQAKRIHIILRFQTEGIEIFAIDNGRGCKNIVKSFGLSGMENRFEAIGGSLTFGSDGESGFTIHGHYPLQRP